MSDRTVLEETEIKKLRDEYPGLPEEYFEYLRTVGWGEAESGHMIYSGPITPEDIYGDGYEGPELWVLGDDYQGYSFAFDPASGLFGEISDFGEWLPGEKEDRFLDYVQDEEEGN